MTARSLSVGSSAANSAPMRRWRSARARRRSISSRVMCSAAASAPSSSRTAFVTRMVVEVVARLVIRSRLPCVERPRSWSPNEVQLDGHRGRHGNTFGSSFKPGPDQGQCCRNDSNGWTLWDGFQTLSSDACPAQRSTASPRRTRTVSRSTLWLVSMTFTAPRHGPPRASRCSASSEPAQAERPRRERSVPPVLQRRLPRRSCPRVQRRRRNRTPGARPSRGHHPTQTGIGVNPTARHPDLRDAGHRSGKRSMTDRQHGRVGQSTPVSIKAV